MKHKAFREMLFLSGTMLLAAFVVPIMQSEPVHLGQAIRVIIVAVIAVAMSVWAWFRVRRA